MRVTVRRLEGSDPPRACTPIPKRTPPTAGTPQPVAWGELELLDVRGDDRMRVAGPTASTLGPGGRTQFMLSRDRLLVWETSSGRLLRNIVLPRPYARPLSVRVSPDGRWVGVSGELPSESDTRLDASRILDLQADDDLAWNDTLAVETSEPVEFFGDGRTARVGRFRIDLQAGTKTEDVGRRGDDLDLPDGRRRLVRARQDHHADPPSADPWDLVDTRDGRVLQRFPAAHGVALSGDGRKLGLIDPNAGRVHVYDTDTYQLIAVVKGARDNDMLALSPDGSKLLLNSIVCMERLSSAAARPPSEGCRSPRLALYDVESGRELWRRRDGAGSRWIFSATGQYLTGPRGRLIEALLRVDDGSEIALVSRGGRVPVSSLSHDDTTVSYTDGTIRRIGDTKPRYEPPRASVIAMADDGRSRVELASTPAGTELRLVHEGRCALLHPDVDPRTQRAHFVGSGLVVTVHGQPRKVRVEGVDTATARTRYALDVQADGGISVAVAGGHVLVQGAHNPRIERYDVETGVRLRDGAAPRRRYASPDGAYVHEVRARNGPLISQLQPSRVVGDGRTVLTPEMLADRWHLSRWDLEDASAVEDHPLPTRPAVMASVEGASTWAVGDDEGGLYILQRGRLEPAVDGDAHGEQVTALLFTPDGTRLLSAARDGSILVIDTATRRAVGRATLPLDYAEHLAFDSIENIVVAETARGQRVRFAWRWSPERRRPGGV